MNLPGFGDNTMAGNQVGQRILADRRACAARRPRVPQQSGQPAVYVNLDSKGARRMRNVTTDNVGKPMAVVFKEKRTVGRDADGKPIKKWVEEVINVATIREPFGRRFQTTGLDSTVRPPAEVRSVSHTVSPLRRSNFRTTPSEKPA